MQQNEPPKNPSPAENPCPDDWAAGVMQGLLAHLGFDPDRVNIVRSSDGGVEVCLDLPPEDSDSLTRGFPSLREAPPTEREAERQRR